MLMEVSDGILKHRKFDLENPNNAMLNLIFNRLL